MAPTKEPTLVELAEQMLEYARQIEAGLPQPPSYQNDTMSELPIHLRDVRMQAIAASENFNQLVRGSRGVEARYWKTVGPYPWIDTMTWDAICRFRVPLHVPLDGKISHDDLAGKCGLHPKDLVELLRYAETMHLFYEPEPGFVAHTVDSRLLVEQPTLFDFAEYCVEQCIGASTKYSESLQKSPGGQEASQAPYALHFGKNFYQHMAEFEGGRWQSRFGNAMVELSCGDEEQTSGAAMAFDWSKISEEAVVVDVGGGNGHISHLLSQRHPNLKFIVQDLPGVVESARSSSTPSVSFMQHDYLTTQPVQNADVYFFAMILHNQADSAVIKILQNLIPALKPGARVLWCDREVLEDDELGRRHVLGVSMVMKILFNAKERTFEEKKTLFEKADDRFEVVGRVVTGWFSVVEAVWRG